MTNLIYIFLYFIFHISIVEARELGETEILTDEGIEVFQNEKYYLLKKNVQINSDDFVLFGDQVKIYFEKDLYDIVKIFADGNVQLDSESYGIKAEGNKIEITVKKEQISVTGTNSKLILEDVTMISDGNINVANINGKFSLSGKNSSLKTETILIIGENIDGIFLETETGKEVTKINVNDNKISNIKTPDTDMYALKASYDKKNSIIELFEEVKVIRGGETITGDYGTLDTNNNSYKVKSNNSKKVKVIISNTDE